MPHYYASGTIRFGLIRSAEQVSTLVPDKDLTLKGTEACDIWPFNLFLDKLTNLYPEYPKKTNVADPGCLSRIPDPTFFPSRIPDPTCLYPRSRILKEFKYLNPKKSKIMVLSSKKYYPGCSSRIPDPDADFIPSRIQGSKKHPIPDPGSGSATLKKTKQKCA
jgi:hypothetical protein